PFLRGAACRGSPHLNPHWSREIRPCPLSTSPHPLSPSPRSWRGGTQGESGWEERASGLPRACARGQCYRYLRNSSLSTPAAVPITASAVGAQKVSIHLSPLF